MASSVLLHESPAGTAALLDELDACRGDNVAVHTILWRRCLDGATEQAPDAAVVYRVLCTLGIPAAPVWLLRHLVGSAKLRTLLQRLFGVFIGGAVVDGGADGGSSGGSVGGGDGWDADGSEESRGYNLADALSALRMYRLCRVPALPVEDEWVRVHPFGQRLMAMEEAEVRAPSF
jgi:hypothetical protein